MGSRRSNVFRSVNIHDRVSMMSEKKNAYEHDRNNSHRQTYYIRLFELGFINFLKFIANISQVNVNDGYTLRNRNEPATDLCGVCPTFA